MGCFKAVAEQTEHMRMLHVSWRAASSALAERVRELVGDLGTTAAMRQPPLMLAVVEAQQDASTCERLRALVDSMWQSVPSHAWVAFPDAHGVWSPQYAAVLLPTLRRAAADSRVVAVSCLRCAKDRKEAGDGIVPMPLSGRGNVEAGIRRGTCVIMNEGHPIGDGNCSSAGSVMRPLGNLVIRLRTLRILLNGTPARTLKHNFCGHRLLYQVQNMFGKRVQVFDAPEGEWMRWVPQLEQSSTLGAVGPVATDLTNLDWQRGAALLDFVDSAIATPGRCGHTWR